MTHDDNPYVRSGKYNHDTVADTFYECSVDKYTIYETTVQRYMNTPYANNMNAFRRVYYRSKYRPETSTVPGRAPRRSRPIHLYSPHCRTNCCTDCNCSSCSSWSRCIPSLDCCWNQSNHPSPPRYYCVVDGSWHGSVGCGMDCAPTSGMRTRTTSEYSARSRDWLAHRNMVQKRYRPHNKEKRRLITRVWNDVDNLPVMDDTLGLLIRRTRLTTKGQSGQIRAYNKFMNETSQRYRFSYRNWQRVHG